MKLASLWILAACICIAAPAYPPLRAQAVPAVDSQRLEALKGAVAADVDSKQKLTQVIIDTLFSYGELGFQEIETSRYLVALLGNEGFTVEEGLAGVPTAWTASWGSGRPVIALGSDIDGIPQASQKPGVAYHDPIVEGAPGHGEGHNSGQAVNVVAALALKRVMEREKIPGTLRLWPGVAEELLATKAYFVRDGYFKDVDAVVFSHVSHTLNVSWGPTRNAGLVSVEYTFAGQPAHSGVSPWRGRSALDAVELMDVGWNFRREHLRLQQRSHYVIPNGGDQPNVVPQVASVWYYFRELDYPHITELWAIGRDIATGAALMTGTTFTERVLGSAWPPHFNRALAEAADANIRAVGQPHWSDADQTLARSLQKELQVAERGLATELEPLRGPVPEAERGFGSDDIGDVSWNVPTIMLGYPSNIPDLPGHSWPSAVSMATPIAHKGATAGSKVLAMTVVDLLLRPEILRHAWTYFRDVQTKDVKYRALVAPTDKPATFMNAKKMAEYRELMKKYYYDASKYPTYLDQLGIKYPTVRPPQ
jgi:aminobenzoyl-glutamate utilization protein B